MNIPRAVGALGQCVDPCVAVDLGAGVTGTDSVGVGDARWIDVTLNRVVERADEVLLLEQWEERLGLGRCDQFEIHTEVAAT